MNSGDLIRRSEWHIDIYRVCRKYTTGLVLEMIESRSKGKTKLYARVLWSAGHHDVWAINCLEVMNEY